MRGNAVKRTSIGFLRLLKLIPENLLFGGGHPRLVRRIAENIRVPIVKFCVQALNHLLDRKAARFCRRNIGVEENLKQNIAQLFA